MLSWSISEKNLPLRYSWTISRNSSDSKINYFIRVGQDGESVLGEVAPNVRYGETPDKIYAGFEAFLKIVPKAIPSLEEFEEMLDELRLPSALRFGIESAFVHLQCRRNRQSIHEFFNLPHPGKVPISYSLPIRPKDELESFWRENKLGRFQKLKVKVNRDTALEVLMAVSGFTSQPLLIDGNECWKDVEELIRFCEKLKSLPVILLEQPMPDGMTDEYIYLKKHSSIPVFADESITSHADFDLLEKQFHGINVKLMKAGGYLNALSQLKSARQRGLGTMIGCMVETSLGISSALHLCSLADHADLDGFLILQEDPFELIHENAGMLSF